MNAQPQSGSMHFDFYDFVLDAATDPDRKAAFDRMHGMFPGMCTETVNHVLNGHLIANRDQTDPKRVRFELAAGIKPLTPAAIKAYELRLKRHDWWHEYSDDHRVWQRGAANLDALRQTARTHPMYASMYDVAAAHFWSHNPCTREEYEQRMDKLRDLEEVDSAQQPVA